MMRLIDAFGSGVGFGQELKAKSQPESSMLSTPSNPIVARAANWAWLAKSQRPIAGQPEACGQKLVKTA